jgi:hypothetical protein
MSRRRGVVGSSADAQKADDGAGTRISKNGVGWNSDNAARRSGRIDDPKRSFNKGLPAPPGRPWLCTWRGTDWKDGFVPGLRNGRFT